MADLAPFPDVEYALREVMADLGTADTVTTPTLQDDLPFIRIMRIGGGDDRFFDTAHVDVDCFAASRADAYALSETVRQRLLDFPHVTSFGLIDSVATNQGPHEVPWDNQNIFRLTANYTLSARR